MPLSSISLLLQEAERLPPAQQIALRTEVNRRRERRALELDLAAFVRAAWVVVEPARELVWNWHLDTACGYLSAFAHRQIRYLILNMPPGSTKSLLASVLFPAWVWSWDPSHRFLCGSNEQSLATRDSLRMRRLVMSGWYRNLWGDRVSVTADQREKMLFENTAGGFRASQGVHADVTGKRGDTIIWDDPNETKTIESDVKRQAVNSAWDDGWSNRKNDPSRSGVLLIQQRSHEDDATGHMLAKESQDWKRVVITMRYAGQQFDAVEIGRPELNDPRDEEGQLFFPERFPESAVDEAEEDLGSYGTAAQHQQTPAPRGGGELKIEWFQRYSNRTDSGRGLRYILVDPAGERKPGRKGRKDNTAMGVLETRSDGNVYLLDGVRDRLGLVERTDLLFQWHAQYKPQCVGYESYGKDSDIAHLIEKMERDEYRFRIVELGGSLRKEDRIRRLIPRLERGGMWFPRSMPKTLVTGKNIDLMDLLIDEEVKSFPVARFDDFLDMLARLEDLEEMKLLKFPNTNSKPPKTTAGRLKEGASWMSV